MNAPGHITVREIVHAAAAVERLRPEQLLGHRRWKELAMPRQRAMFLARALAPVNSYPAIARVFNGRNHTTVLHGARKVQGMLAAGDNAEHEAVAKTLEQLGIDPSIRLDLGRREPRQPAMVARIAEAQAALAARREMLGAPQ